MADNEKHFEQQTEFKLSEEFSNALSDLFTTDQSVPPEVDRAILDMAHKHITAGPRHRLSVLRWAGAASAVAAVIIIMVILSFPGPDTMMRSDSSPIFAKADIDGNGRTDILDAFTLARHIERTDKPNKKWDFNNDGIIDRKDTDIVAFAAVRLDKGVL